MNILKNNSNIKLIFLLLIVVINILIFFLINGIKKDKIDEYLDTTTKKYQLLYNYITNDYTGFADFIYKDLMLDGNIQNSLEAIKNANISQKELIREKLYISLKDKFKNLQMHNLNHLYILEADNTVFLRVHKMDKFGDDASTYRSMMYYAKEHKKPIHGYENGKRGGAFRYIFPIIKDDEVLGYIEATFSEVSLVSTFLEHYETKINFWIDKEDIDKKIFDYYKPHYIQSPKKEYYFKSDIEEYLVYKSSAYVPSSKDELSFLEKVYKDMKTLDKAVSVYDEKEHYAITAIPIKHILEENILAFITMKTSAGYIQNILTFFYPILLISMTFTSWVFWSFYMLLMKNRDTQKLLDTQSSIIIITNGKEIKKGNQRFLDFFGFDSIEEFKEVNSCICDFFIEDKANGHISRENWLEKALDGKQQGKVITVKMLSFDNKPNFFQLEVEKLDSLSYIATFTNITITIKHQEELELLNNTLEFKIKQAVEENRKKDQALQQQSKLASMGEMIGAIAHQWRQPLNAININIQNLEEDYQEGLIDEKFLEEFMSKNRSIIEFMSKTIDDFRNFFRIDKEKRVFSVKKAIQDVINIQQAQLKNNNITLIFEGDDFEIDGFESEFTQVILNIISNAKDAILGIKNPKGIIMILLSDKTISIKDNGGGVSLDIINRIFEPYFTTKEQGQGTGMGLYMSKMIIEDNMKGTISVVNDEEGAVFKLSF